MSRALPTIGFCMLAMACGDPSSPAAGGRIQLTAAQAATLDARIDQIVAGSADLAWLADSANLVLREGAVVDTVSIQTTLGGGPYYGVGLQRAISSSANRFSTFDAILFNSPSNPTRFIFVSGYAKGTSSPPAAVTGSVGFRTTTQTLTAHLFAIDGASVTHWSGTSGTVMLAGGTPGGTCPSFTATATVTCTTTPLEATAQIAATIRESGSASGTPTVALANVELRGIRLAFQFP